MRNPEIAEINKVLTKIPIKHLRIGVVNFGRPAPGINNVIEGLLRFSEYGFAEIIGFVGGIDALYHGTNIVVTKQNFQFYKNQGGGDFLGCSTRYLPWEGEGHIEEFEKIHKTLKSLHIDGLVITGATHNMSSACYLAEYLVHKGSDVRIIGVPTTVDNNMKHGFIEATVGFDSASKVFSQLTGNIFTDAASSVKYWYFI